MITGTVYNRRAHIELFIRGSAGQGNVEFIVDTGFTGFMTLPLAACVALALPFQRRQPSFLADASNIMLDVYEITLLLEGQEQVVDVLAMESEPLIGMSLLDGCDIRIQAVEGGIVTLERI